VTVQFTKYIERSKNTHLSRSTMIKYLVLFQKTKQWVLYLVTEARRFY